MIRRFTIDAESAGHRIDKVLARLWPEVSRGTIQRWIDEGRVRSGDRIWRRSDPAVRDQVVEIEAGIPVASDAEPDPSVPFSVLFEDEALIVVDKPAGVVVHPARGHRSGTLVSGLLARPGFGRPPQDPNDVMGSVRPGIVHRIDKDTSGLLVIAKTERAREGLKQQFQRREVRRRYWALTLGVPQSGRIETLYGRHPTARVRFSSRVRRGKPSITNLELQEMLARGAAARIECRLETGRTHQIRVHLAECRMTPILGDRLYGGMPRGGVLAEIAERMGRQALHARSLGFVHPLSGEELDFEAPPPPELTTALLELRVLVP